MPSHFKRLLLLYFWISSALGSGTQFLSIPASAYDLIYFHSPWRNPAALNHLDRVPELSFAYGKWLAGTKAASLKWRGQIGKSRSGGLDIRYIGLDDIELRPNKPTSQPLGYYASYGFSARGVVSLERGNHQFGIAIQSISLQIYQESSSGLALDLGWGWSLRPHLKFTVSALNLGKMNALKELEPQLPQRIISGILWEKESYRAYVGMESNSLVNDSILYIGGNGQYKNLIYGGTFMHTDGMKSLSSGVGFQFGIYSIRYGMQWGDHHLGMPQIIDISIRLP